MKNLNSLVLALGLIPFFHSQASNAKNIDIGDHNTSIPEYQAGEVFIYSDRRVEWLHNINDNKIIWTTRKQRPFVRDQNFVLPILEWQVGQSRGQRNIFGNPEALWPLREGNSMRFRSVTEQTNLDNNKKRRSVEYWRCKVSDASDISIIAGTFFSYEISCDRYSPTSMNLLKRRIWYYSPAVGHYIKRKTINYFTGNIESYELVATLNGRNANPRRVNKILSILRKSK